MFKRGSTIIMIIVLVLAFATPALAEPPVTPYGPFLTDTQTVQIDSYHDYDQLVKALKEIEERSKGEVKLEVIGQSNQGRDIYMAKAGHGPDNVMIITQQHGNEPHGTEAMLNMLQDIALSGKPVFKQVREQLTVNIVLRVNPDGAILEQRYNYDPLAPNARTYARDVLGWSTNTRLDNETYGMYSSAGVGWDLNRFNFIDWTTSPMYRLLGWPENPGTEAACVAQAVATLNPKPLWFIDLHEQGNTVTPDGSMVTFALDTAHVTNDWTTDLQDPRVQESCRLLVIINDYTSQYGYATASRYSEPSAFSGRSRNQYLQELDIPGILIEMRGQYEGLGQKSGGMLIKNAYQAVYALVEATVNDTIKDVDWTRVSEIPNAISVRKDLPASPNEGAGEEE